MIRADEVDKNGIGAPDNAKDVIRRFPVSLVMDTRENYFVNHIAWRKENRVLSEFIVNLFRAYNDLPELKLLVDDYIDTKSATSLLQESVAGVNLRLRNLLNNNEAIGNVIEAGKSTVDSEQTGTSVKKQQTAESESAKIASLETKIDSVANQLAQVANVLSMLTISGLASTLTPQTIQTPPAIQGHQQAVSDQQTKRIVEQIESSQTIRTVQPTAPVGLSFESEDDVVLGGSEQTAPVQNVPKGFSKLTKSVNK